MTYGRLATIIGMVALAVAVSSGSAQAAVEDILLEKGQITKEDWLKIKAEKEKEAAQTPTAPASTVSNLLKGIELKATFYFDYTYATGDSFTGDVANKGLNNTTANNNQGVLPGLEVRVGQHQTPWIEYEEHRWTYRFRGPVMVDEQNFQTSSDLGVSVLGKVLNNKVDYHIALQSGEGYQNTQDGRG